MISLLLLAGCVEGERFWFRNAGADMPVWVRGPTDPSARIVFLAGGPGDPTQLSPRVFPDTASQLEAHYEVVYWDQRGSGVSQGNPSPDTLTPEQYADDADVLVQLLEERRGPMPTFLWGHSWGGALGVQFLSDPDRASRIAGWIEEDGAHDMVHGFEAGRRWLQGRIDEGDGDWDREEAQAFLDANPRIDADNYVEHWHWIDAAGGVFQDPSLAFTDVIGATLFGPMTGSALTGPGWIRRHLDVTQLELDPTAVEVPTLLLWGRHDGLIPVEVAERTAELTGAELRVFERSGHSPHIEEPDAFVEELRTFVEKTR